MIKVYDVVYKTAEDLIRQKLDEIAVEAFDDGHGVDRGEDGSVRVKLDDGEVHFIPEGGIRLVAYVDQNEYEEV